MQCKWFMISIGICLFTTDMSTNLEKSLMIPLVQIRKISYGDSLLSTVMLLNFLSKVGNFYDFGLPVCLSVYIFLGRSKYRKCPFGYLNHYIKNV